MLTSFNPVRLSNEENEFLLEHLGQPTLVALRTIKGVTNPKPVHTKEKNPTIYPEGVVPSAVKPILDGINELMDLEKHEGIKWVGIEKVKDAIKVWLRENAKWAADFKRTRGRAPRYPSLYSFDARGKAYLSGPGSDSGEVRTYFGPSGERIPFEIDLMSDYVAEWAPPAVHEDITDVHLKVDAEASRIECRVPKRDEAGVVCGHVETYKAGSRASYNAARARMSKHLRKETDNAEVHREVHTLEFGTARN